MVRYPMKLSVSVFGDYGYNINSIISEFSNFISNNSLLDPIIITGTYPPLQDSEFGTPDTTWGYFVSPWNLLPSTKEKIPSLVQINILMYDWKNKRTSYGGGTYGGDWGLYTGVPYIGIPLGQSPYNEQNPWGSWQTLIAQRLVHEWMHGFKWILDYKFGLTGFPNADGVCETYGYTVADGWYSCYKFFLSNFITTQMYEAIQSNNPCMPITCILSLS